MNKYRDHYLKDINTSLVKMFSITFRTSRGRPRILLRKSYVERKKRKRERQRGGRREGLKVRAPRLKGAVRDEELRVRSQGSGVRSQY